MSVRFLAEATGLVPKVDEESDRAGAGTHQQHRERSREERIQLRYVPVAPTPKEDVCRRVERSEGEPPVDKAQKKNRDRCAAVCPHEQEGRGCERATNRHEKQEASEMLGCFDPRPSEVRMVGELMGEALREEPRQETDG